MKDAIVADGIFPRRSSGLSLQSMWKIGQSMPIVAETETRSTLNSVEKNLGDASDMLSLSEAVSLF